MATDETTHEFRIQRKVIKDILTYDAPDGLRRDELAKMAEAKGLGAGDFQKVLTSLFNSGHAYQDSSGRVRYMRNE